MSTTLKWLLIILGVVVLGTAVFYGSMWYLQNQEKKNKSNLLTNSQKTSDKTDKSQDKQGECGAGWKIYQNQEVGYKLCHPETWTVKEVNTTSETIGGPVKYIMIFNESKKYFLHFGLKKTTNTFTTTDRTGVGAGEMTKKPTDKFKLLEVDVTPEAHIWNSKIVEYFYPQPSGTITTCSCEFNSSFGYDSTAVDYDAANTPDADYQTSIKILKTVEWL